MPIINGSPCPENQNSTDCLLKALLDAVGQQGKAEDAEFNWDPLSFGFTAPVGILAALFTFMTVVQMIVSSGPGRRRSDKQVIGRWASRKKTRLSWSEMRLLTIVPTPVLKIPSLRDSLNAQQRATAAAPTTGRWRGRLSKLIQPTRKYLAMRSEERGFAWGILASFNWWRRLVRMLPMADTTQSSRAKWLVQLDELDLEEFIFENGESEDNAADYLPDDLQAVPAYSEVGCTVALAAASGISSLKVDPQSPYPLVIGKDFQLNFRDHPLLGSIGVFSRHGRREVWQGGRPSKEEVLLALHHAEGQVQSRAKGFVSSRQLYVNGHPFRPHCKCGGNPEDLMCSSAALLHEKHKNVGWLLAAATPRRVPAIFPSSSVKLRNVLTTFILQNQSWAYIRGSRLEDHIRSIFPSEYGPMRVWWTDDRLTELLCGDLGERLSYFLATDTQRNTSLHHPEYSFLLQPNICGVISEVFQLCFRFSYDSDDFEDWWQTLSEQQVRMNRIAILIQIQQLDKLLAITDPNLLECRKTIVYLTAQAFLIVEEDVASQTLDADRLIQLLKGTTKGTSTFWDVPRTHLFHHFEPTLKTLDALLTPHGDKKAAGFDGEFARQESRLKTIVSPWYSPDPSGPCQAREALLQRIKDSVNAYKTVQEGIDGQRETDGGPRSAKIEEVVDDIIIWRIVLLGLLFLTAPDNSAILDSGLWRHVIPLL